MNSVEVLQINAQDLIDDRSKAISSLVKSILSLLDNTKVIEYLKIPNIDVYSPTTQFGFDAKTFYFGRGEYYGIWIDLNELGLTKFLLNKDIESIQRFVDEFIASVKLLNQKVQTYNESQLIKEIALKISLN